MFFEFIFFLSCFFFFNLLVKTNFTKNSILVALFIVGAFILAGFIYLIVDFTPLGIILVLVYVGAVVVLFLFVTIMMPLRTVFVYYNSSSYLLAYSLWFLFLCLFFCNYGYTLEYFNFFSKETGLFYLLGILLYLDKIWYFIIAAFLLTISIIGAISITQTKIVDATKFKENISTQLNKSYKVDINLYN